MWIYFFLGMATLFAAMFAARRFTSARPRDIARVIRTFVATLSGLAGMGFLAAGRFGLAILLFAATVITLYRLRQSGRPASRWNAGSNASPGGTSEVETSLLRMRLDRSTGEVEGEVLRGPLEGRELSSLALGEWLDLLRLARLEDEPSVSLIEASLDRHHPDWRDFADGRSERGDDMANAADGAMTDEMAFDILGLSPGADAAEIRAAHRKLMANFHPDRGGSTYLASQINRAREHLLARMADQG
ncbi:MAG: DnaJ domain-containing protein [Geminicoccaceae bacterium]